MLLTATDQHRTTEVWHFCMATQNEREYNRSTSLYMRIVSVCVCVWLTENDKLIQSLPRLSIFITPHILFLCSFSSTATFRGSVLYRLEQKVHSCELHFHLYRIFIASRPSEILFTLRSFTHVSHIAPAPEYVGWFESSGLSCCSCCFDSFWHTARRRPMVSSRPVSSSSLSLSCSASLARNGKFSTLDGK